MRAKWTFMVYLAGFNNLAEFAVTDLDEMREIGSGDEVRIAAFVKRQGEDGARCLIIEKGGVAEAPEPLGDADSGSPQTLLDFIRWVKRQAPADRYALIIWNHGSGWQPDDLNSLYQNVRGRLGSTGVTPREFGVISSQPIGRALFSTTVEKVLELPTSGDRGIASDDGTGHSLDTIELSNVLAVAHEELGGPLELLGMDACLMSNQEVAYQAAAHVRFVVASEDLEPGDGWPYTDILRRLSADPDMDGGGLGTVVVEEYIRSYANGSDAVTQCVVDVGRMPSFAGPLEQFAQVLRTAVVDRDDRSEIGTAQANSVRFQGDLVDVRSFCDNLLDGQVSDAVKKAARAVVESLEPGGYVVAEGHHGAKVAGVGGVTVYLPSPFEEISRFYRDLRFAKETSWDEFLVDYRRALRNR